MRLTAVLGGQVGCRQLSCLLEVGKDGILQCSKPELLLIGSARVDGVRSRWSVQVDGI